MHHSVWHDLFGILIYTRFISKIMSKITALVSFLTHTHNNNNNNNNNTASWKCLDWKSFPQANERKKASVWVRVTLALTSRRWCWWGGATLCFTGRTAERCNHKQLVEMVMYGRVSVDRRKKKSRVSCTAWSPPILPWFLFPFVYDFSGIWILVLDWWSDRYKI